MRHDRVLLSLVVGLSLCVALIASSNYRMVKVMRRQQQAQTALLRADATLQGSADRISAYAVQLREQNKIMTGLLLERGVRVHFGPRESPSDEGAL